MANWFFAGALPTVVSFFLEVSYRKYVADNINYSLLSLEWRSHKMVKMAN